MTADPKETLATREESMQFEAIEHVQLAMPEGQEDKARLFFCELLGLEEVLKPPELAKRGGAWFESGSVRIHLGIEQDFSPAKKAHPAFLVSDLAGFAAQLRGAGYAVTVDADLPGFNRFYVNDPFGNRLEFMEPG